MRPLPRVLFLCVKNAGKSQMAAALMRSRAGDVVVESAGTHAGTELNELSVRSLLEVGIDIRDRRPRPLTDEMIERVDLLVILGRDADVDRTYGVRVERWDTVEPSERGIDGVERMRLVRDDIDRRVQALAAQLRQPPSP